jgi:uncharacterized protein YpmB
MKKEEKKQGVSLIVLIIAIIVIVILAGAVILNFTKNNPINTSKEAVFKSDLSTILEQLSLYKMKQSSNNLGNFDESTMNGKVSDFVSEITKYDSELSVVGGKLSYIGNDVERINIARDMGLITRVVEVGGIKYNKPDLSGLLSASTTAISWNASNVESSISLSTANTSTSWYDYGSKKWANIKTSNNGNDAYWVWIPRYAYKITNSHTATAEQINIIFLSGTSNTPVDGSSLPSGYIVHPAFSFGGTELSGIWVAKYEASSSSPNAVDGNGYTGGGNNTTLQVRVLPSVYSWRYISTGNAQTVSMNMTSSTGSVGTTTDVDTHQMKNVEWGAVAYLCQSQYGTEPWINPFGDWTARSYKIKTGYAGASKDSGALAEGNASLSAYNTTNGVKASTTGNIYGVYDMSGGTWEMTAAVLNNGNSNIGTYGTSTYVTNNKIKTEYAKYYDIYEPGDEEKEGGAYYGTAGETLWNSGKAQSQNIIRKRLTDATYAKFATKKGDALYETSNTNSYYGMYTSGTANYDWLTSTLRDSSAGAQYSTDWNGDLMLVGHAYQSWFYRGGGFDGNSSAGVFGSYAYYGGPFVGFSFRPVLVLGSAL